MLPRYEVRNPKWCFTVSSGDVSHTSAVFVHDDSQRQCPLEERISPATLERIDRLSIHPSAHPPPGIHRHIPATHPLDFRSVAFQDISVDIHPVEETGLVRPLAVPSVRTRLVGSHQRDNAAAAVAAASAALASLGRPLSADAVSRGLAGAFLPGRLQVLPVASLGPDGVEGGPAKLHVVLDGAHTAESALALARAIRGMFGEGTPVAAVMAMAQDKDHDGTCLGLREMRPLAVMFAGGNGTVGYSGRKAAAPGVLAAAWQRAGIAHRRSGGGRTVCREQVRGAALSRLDVFYGCVSAILSFSLARAVQGTQKRESAMTCAAVLCAGAFVALRSAMSAWRRPRR